MLEVEKLANCTSNVIDADDIELKRSTDGRLIPNRCRFGLHHRISRRRAFRTVFLSGIQDLLIDFAAAVGDARKGCELKRRRACSEVREEGNDKKQVHLRYRRIILPRG